MLLNHTQHSALRTLTGSVAERGLGEARGIKESVQFIVDTASVFLILPALWPQVICICHHVAQFPRLTKMT